MSDKEEHGSTSLRQKEQNCSKNKKLSFGSNVGFIDDMDKSSLYTFPNPLIRIEYPGNVKNVGRAIQSLGGMHEIEKCTDGKSKLELKFHFTSQFNKGCLADKDTSLGLLIKLKQTEKLEYSYEIVNATDTSFKFNRMCDFQYLPLLSKGTSDTEDSEVEYLYENVMPRSLPTLDWLNKKEISEQQPVLIASNFARYDLPHVKFQTDSTDTFLSLIRPKGKTEYACRKKPDGLSHVATQRVNFFKPNFKTPDQPSIAMEYIKERKWEHHYRVIHEMFEKRPIWIKGAILHLTGISNDIAKYVLPCIAYFCHSGPWRVCWIKYGYNPTQDFNSRIYQVLDFRIRSTDMQLKVKVKRSVLSALFTDESSSCPRRAASERDYMLKPNVMPPARHMFYQYCDILIPEIQEMVAKLPKLPSTAKYDVKNGWLPLSFTEHCREVVKKFITDMVQNELLTEAKPEQTQEGPDQAGGIVTLYCSKMLNTLRRGKVASTDAGPSTENMEQIDLIDDNTSPMDVSEIISDLPEQISDASDDEESDMDIDIDAVQDINGIILGSRP